MALDMEEQDQEENLKNLWSKYKNIAFIAIGIFLCFYIAATFISNKKNKANELASQLYQEVLMEKIDNLEQIKVKTDLVKKDHINTPYAGRASLHLGQLYAKTGDYDKSIPELSWAGENATELSIQSLAHYALAYMYIAKKDASNFSTKSFDAPTAKLNFLSVSLKTKTRTSFISFFALSTIGLKSFPDKP